MIKRIAVFSVLLIYLITTAGFAMSLHFCGTNISDIRINQDPEKSCCADETKSNTGKCCQSKQIHIKVSDEQQIIHSAKIPAVVNLDLFVILEKITNPFFVTSNTLSRLSYREPPELPDIPYTIQNCVFRI